MGRDVLLVGAQTTLLAYDVQENADLFFKGKRQRAPEPRGRSRSRSPDPQTRTLADLFPQGAKPPRWGSPTRGR
eukprot:5970058-Prymnesium_polylepis.2